MTTRTTTTSTATDPTDRPAARPSAPDTRRHVVLGKGPVGAALTDLLVASGAEVRVLSRSGAPSGPVREGVHHVAVDASDASALAEAARGADVIYNCANPVDYHRWAELWPPMARALLDAAEANDAVLATVGNLYGYGPVDRPITVDTPLSANGPKGRVRVQMWDEALERHRQGRVRVVEARAADFYGPRITEGGHLGERVVPKLLAGKGVRLLGDLDVAHSFTYVPDVARALLRLGGDERAWGRAWPVPTAPAVSQRRMVELLCSAAGVDPVPVRRLPWSAVRLAGVVLPFMRELAETRHQLDGPFVLDAAATTATFGDEPTPLEVGAAATIEWWRSH
jgi:nucleoside-diphosphate-sugar epimerase